MPCADALVSIKKPRRLRRRGYLMEFARLLEKETGRTYFSELLIDENLSLSEVPRPFTTAIIARAMPAAISPYSIAVAPD